MYYDIHTHSHTAIAGTFGIVNVHGGFANAIQYQGCSMGLHPWYLEEHSLAMQQLTDMAASPNVLAIGECGLDKLCNTDWQLQCTVFEQQVALAGSLNKPLIIHCVHAYSEVLAILARSKVAVPVVFHGYNKKQLIADGLLLDGFYLSFGKAILNSSSPAAAVLAAIDPGKYFLETDDARLPIADIYKRTAEIRKNTEDAIILQQTINFQKVFNR